MHTYKYHPQRIIYDIGSNNGDDIPYYLKKADVVVAVEANPLLCKRIVNRFSDQIASNKLFVENCVVVAEDEVSSEVDFYVSRTNDRLSQFPKPEIRVIDGFDRISVRSRSVSSLIQHYGTPHYVKIDIEHYDHAVLKALFLRGIKPPFISAESHDIHVFCLLVSIGEYNAFKLVDGSSVSKTYLNHQIVVQEGTEQYSFPEHSAGPFGEDLLGDWLSAEEFFKLLAFEGLGWKDIHATNLVAPRGAAAIQLSNKKIIEFVAKLWLKPLLSNSIWKSLSNISSRVF